MAAYLQKAKDLLSTFRSYTIQQVSRAQNAQADALACLVSAKDAELLVVILVEFLNEPNIHMADQPQTINCTTMTDSWMIPIVQDLKENQVLEDKSKARLLRLKAARYILYNGQLYRRRFSTLILKCVDLEEGNYIFWEIHEGVCGNHAGWQSLAHKALR